MQPSLVVERIVEALLETVAERMVDLRTAALLVENDPQVVSEKMVVDETQMDHRILQVESLEHPRMGSEMHSVHSASEALVHRKKDPDSPT